ncbi:MAG TPA: DUF6660 family protein [Sphingobacteriaceae bacterium]
MKLISIILSFLILSMALMPCGEGTEAHNDESEMTSAPSDDHSAPDDNCNAFCQCARCPFSVLIPETDQVMAHEMRPSAPPAELSVTVIDVSFPIWQPPKQA